MLVILVVIGIFALYRLLDACQLILLFVLDRRLKDRLLVHYTRDIAALAVVVVPILVILFVSLVYLIEKYGKGAFVATFIFLLWLLPLTSSLSNIIGIAVLMIDRPCDIGDEIEISNVSGEVLSAKSQFLILSKSGGGFTEICGKQFLLHPLINHSRRTEIQNWQNIRVALKSQLQNVPDVIRKLEYFLRMQQGYAFAKVFYSCPGEVKVITVEGAKAYPEFPTFSIEIRNGAPISYPRFMQKRSEILLSVREYLQNSGIEVV